MAIGPQDYIDQMLAKKYAQEKVNNTEDTTRLNMSSARYWELQKDIADVQRTLVMVSTQFKSKMAATGMKKATGAA